MPNQYLDKLHLLKKYKSKHKNHVYSITANKFTNESRTLFRY